jgi:hypothetical protein
LNSSPEISEEPLSASWELNYSFLPNDKLLKIKVKWHPKDRIALDTAPMAFIQAFAERMLRNFEFLFLFLDN